MPTRRPALTRQFRDFALCSTDDCPSRETCERSPASGNEPENGEVWVAFVHDGEGCDGFIPSGPIRLIPPRQAHRANKSR